VQQNIATKIGAEPHRVDTHYHILPDCFMSDDDARERLLAVSPPRAISALLDWTPASAIEALDRGGVQAAVTSMPPPGTSSRALARGCNEFAARLAGDHKGRFGVFAMLPLPDIEGSLREIEYALDVLRLDGIGLLTNCNDRWPGDELFAPIYDELERRKAVVYYHPHMADCCRTLLPGTRPPLIEYPFDTTRAIVSLFINGTLSRCPNIRFIFSHGGGTLPMLAHRIEDQIRTQKDLHERFPNGAIAEFSKLYLDVVSVANPIAFDSVRKLVGIPRLLFGSDFPFWSPEVTVANLAKLNLRPDDLGAIERGNALGLFPRLEQLVRAESAAASRGSR
jgi:predicted TIM-barrel fold metal-dependent hydrolase